MIEFIFNCFLFSIFGVFLSFVAWTYAEICTEPGMIFNWLFTFACERLPAWLAKPFITCVFCVSGQISLWGYIILIFTTDIKYNFFHHIITISFSIFSVLIIDKLLNHGKSN